MVIYVNDQAEILPDLGLDNSAQVLDECLDIVKRYLGTELANIIKEAVSEIREEADTSQDEYNAVCGLNEHLNSVITETLDRIQTVCEKASKQTRSDTINNLLKIKAWIRKET